MTILLNILSSAISIISLRKKANLSICDGVRNFQDTYKKEYWTFKNPRTKHIEHTVH
jgi:hypothetical protein